MGEKNFLNEPGTWDLLAKVDELAKKYDTEDAASFINGVLGSAARAEFPQGKQESTNA